jgi:hypothetical protein
MLLRSAADHAAGRSMQEEQCSAVASTFALGMDQCAHSHMNVHVLVPSTSSVMTIAASSC